MGGTALRMCYEIKRYSEDLDFTLDDKKEPYQFSFLIHTVTRELGLRGFDISSSFQEDKVVQKGFLKFGGLGPTFGLKSFQGDQKLHVKLEVDIKPPLLKKKERESFFVSRFGEIFPILKHTLPTLFAGKVLALLYRPYARGRDYYDLIWYLSQKVDLNLDYLNRGAKLKGEKFRNVKEVFKILEKKVMEVKPSVILKDVGRFLEDPSEQKWFNQYEKVFNQLVTSYQFFSQK